jgi:hypothetical protein
MEASIRLTTKEEKDDPSIPAFDYTTLTALNTCPRFGLVRYVYNKAMPHNSRSMALELGSAAHQCFAAIRLFEAMEHYPYDNEEEDRIHFSIQDYGVRLFGAERMERFMQIWCSEEDTRRRVNAIALYIANTSGFYDDPGDRRRTLSNLETSLIAYIDRLELGSRIPVVRDGLIGIEVPFDLLLTFTHEHANDYDLRDPIETKIRYIGRMDGLVHTKYGIEVEENKTASRLDQSWMNSFLISHQVTGYCVAASTLLREPVKECMVRGMMVPLPKTYDLGGIANVSVSRDSDRIAEWYRWIWDTVSHQYLPYKDDPLSAPEYSHSCNRYFSSCSFIPLCAMASREERLRTFNAMVTDRWSPLDEQV